MLWIATSFCLKIGTHRGKKAAEGETVPAIVRAVRRVDRRRIEFEVVSSSRSTRSISGSARRPPVAVLASVPKGTRRYGQIETPAAHITQDETNYPTISRRFRSSIIYFLRRSSNYSSLMLLSKSLRGELHDL